VVRSDRNSEWLGWDVNRLGFRTGRSNGTYLGRPDGSTTDWVTVPLWLVLALAAAVPAARVAAWARGSRLASGACRRWGCDLRATPARYPSAGDGMSGQPAAKVRAERR
jgi:hypothetical protein